VKGWWVLLFGLMGCSDYMTKLGDSDPDTGEYDSPVQVLSIDPSWGSPGGGTVVTIEGEGFEGAIDVYFGNAPVNVTKLGPDTLMVTTPAAGAEMTVDVQVISELGQATAVDGFSYSDSQPDDTDDVTGTGKTGGVIEFSHLQTMCPQCFGVPEITVTASAAFHDPKNGSWMDWMPSLGSCALNPSSQPLSSSFVDVGNWVYLSTGSRTLALSKSQSASGPSYVANSSSSDDFVRTAYYDLQAPDGGSLGAIEQTDALLTPMGFDSIEPMELLWFDPSDAFDAYIAKSGASFSWSPAGSGTFSILLGVYSANGSSLLGTVLCRDYDKGYMVIPGNYLSSFPNYSLVAVYLYRYETSESVLANNGSTLEGVASMGVLGTGTLLP
jgi:hypothetical protein